LAITFTEKRPTSGSVAAVGFTEETERSVDAGTVAEGAAEEAGEDGEAAGADEAGEATVDGRWGRAAKKNPLWRYGTEADVEELVSEVPGGVAGYGILMMPSEELAYGDSEGVQICVVAGADEVELDDDPATELAA
jgi:hypothetical protein